MVKGKKKSRGVRVYSNLVSKHKKKRDSKARKKAEYLATLPKHPVKRLMYRLHPKRMAKYWFSKQGLFTLLKAAGVAVIIAVLFGLSLFAYYRKDLDKISPSTLAQRVKSTVTKYYDRNDKLLWEDKGSGDYTLVVDADTIAPCMGEATIAIEDKDFYNHGGVSISGTMRAAISNIEGNATQGGSTLTQQLVKQVFFSNEEAGQRGLGGIPRKIKEMILSVEVERLYTKDQILGMYLNESPYGGRRNGVESAARTYFGVPSSKLNLSQCAILAAIPNNPTIYNPYYLAGQPSLIERQHKVLDNMVDLKYITEAEAEAAKQVPILDTIKPETDQLEGIQAPHFVLMVRQELEKQLGKTVVGEGGLTVRTTLDLDVQNVLQDNMTKIFNGEMTNRDCGYRNCSAYAGFSNGAAAIEDTKTGQVVALVGSRDFSYPGFGQDNASTAFIQPGSSIKPLVYAQLFQNQGEGKVNYGSGSILSDSFTDFNGYKPQDADGKFKGSITLRQSLAWSRNIPAIKAMAINEANEEGSTWETIRALGDKYYCTVGADAQAGLSSAIGGCGTRLVDHVNAIASLGRNGVYTPQTMILKVTNAAGQTLKEYKASSKQVIDPQAAYIVTDMLGDAKARAGLGWNQDYLPSLSSKGIRAAAKTGTSNAQIGKKILPKDIWTVGYTPSLSMAVWLGNPDTTPLSNGNSLIPAMFFDRTMASATEIYVNAGKAKYNDWFTAPSGIQTIKGELYPSYYNKNTGVTNMRMTFDRVSKKKATDCTPAGARIEIGVSKTVDPITKKDVFFASEGYDASKDDDIHKCGQEPTVSLNAGTGSISVTYTSGSSYAIKSVTLTQGSVSITHTGGSPWSLSNQQLAQLSSGPVTVTVTDEAYYSTSKSDTYTE